MNDAQVIGAKYFGNNYLKSDMGRYCPCGQVMSLGHILIGCTSYKLQPLLEVMLNTLKEVSPHSAFRTLHPDEWGISLWYPLLALRMLEETALPIFKGRKTMLKALKKSRPKREWIIGNYYWMLWKWCMKEIHEDKFKFMPMFCVTLLREALLRPCPALDRAEMPDGAEQAPLAKVRLTDNAYS